MKKTITAITMAMILMLGTTLANAEGILVADRSATATCTSVEKDGIIIFNIVATIYQVTGILVADRPAPCTDSSKDGILVAD